MDGHNNTSNKEVTTGSFFHYSLVRFMMILKYFHIFGRLHSRNKFNGQRYQFWQLKQSRKAVNGIIIKPFVNGLQSRKINRDFAVTSIDTYMIIIQIYRNNRNIEIVVDINFIQTFIDELYYTNSRSTFRGNKMKGTSRPIRWPHVSNVTECLESQEVLLEIKCSCD